MSIAAIIPAYNEAVSVGKTIDSLKAQTVPLQRIIVVANNCTDNTAEVAEQHGAEVMVIPNNPGKKAGALNAALDLLIPGCGSEDFVMTMDADSVIAPDFLEQAQLAYKRRPELGGLSGAVRTRKGRTFIENAQAIEFARSTRMMGRNGGRVHVISGTAALFRSVTLREVAAARGRTLPGQTGDYYLTNNLTEDYELTLAIQKIGYQTGMTKHCVVETDLMPSEHALREQRIRWYRGTLETTALYGWHRVTRRTWGRIVLGYVQFLVMWTAIVLVGVAAVDGHAFVGWWWWWWMLVPLFMAESVVNAKRVNRRAIALAVVVLPMWIYDQLRFIYSWQALYRALRRNRKVWLAT